MPRVNPEILVWARETAGLGPEAAARKLGLRDSRRASAVDKLAALELGEAEPTRPQLVKMAQQYRRPLLAFYLPEPPAKGERGTDFRTQSGGNPAADDATLDALVRDVRARQSMVRAVLVEEEEAERLAFIASCRIEDGRDAALAALRTLLGVRVAEYRAQRDAASAFNLLRGAAERAGIFVLLKGDLGNYRTALDTGVFRGFAIADDVAPFIVINDQDARPAWSFTLLHEAAHLLLGHTGVGSAHTDSGVERFCDDVAGAFLLPAGELDDLDLGGSDLGGGDMDLVSEQISRFAGERRVSRTMVAYQAYRAGRISREMFRGLSVAYRRQWRQEQERQRAAAREREGGPNYYAVRRHRLGNRLTGLVRRMMAADALATSKAARILGVRPGQVQPLLDAGGRQRGQA